MDGDGDGETSCLPIKTLIGRIRVSNLDSRQKIASLQRLLKESLSKDLLDMNELMASGNTKRDAINNLKLYLAETQVNRSPEPAQRASPLELQKEGQVHKDKCNVINLEEMNSSTSKIDPEEMNSSTNKIDSPTSHEVPNATTPASTNVNRPSLMETCSSARAHEWNDSIDDLSGGTSNHACGFHLPSPKRKRFSPSKSPETSNIKQRRKRWSQLEQETLKTGVNTFGEGSWKQILNSYKEIFNERTPVDLKDKWRNLKRHGGK